MLVLMLMLRTPLRYLAPLRSICWAMRAKALLVAALGVSKHLQGVLEAWPDPWVFQAL